MNVRTMVMLSYLAIFCANDNSSAVAKSSIWLFFLSNKKYSNNVEKYCTSCKRLLYLGQDDLQRM